MKQIVMGILAHVDAGKTTLSEAILYLTGNIRKLGRVDHKDAFLDNFALERERGITIFSKQARFSLPDTKVTLLDTPGHLDFSAEMERTLQVLDYAVLVVSGADGVQGHTKTLWKLLKRYHIPTFIFVNKMDQAGTDREWLYKNICSQLSDSCLAFDGEKDEQFFENVAVCDDGALDYFLEEGSLSEELIAKLIKERKVFPVYFGSALKLQGLEKLLEDLNTYMYTEDAGEAFGARVYKISRDAKGNRLTHMKVTSGKLLVKEAFGQEKINQIRFYSGEKYETGESASAGMICTVTGLEHSYAGMGIGILEESETPLLEPVLNYRVILPDGVDEHKMLEQLRQLEEEDPMLRIVWEEEYSEIQLQLMGEVQLEVLHSMILERFGVDLSFDKGNIVYKETIENKVEGVGHYEPLRHYAEVHLILEPLEKGSGLEFESACSEDLLDKNWQRLILTHLEEKRHRGVLINAELTDVKLTLVAGRAHLKHTEGGDFRQATYRAIRQGLMQAKSVILEPYYEFTLEIPSEYVGRAMTDIQRMCGEFKTPATGEEMTVISGSAPVSTMRDYQTEVLAYTKGKGHLNCIFKGYEKCHNEEEVIETADYDPAADMQQPSGSVFCAHGAGFYVAWDQVPEFMHLESVLKKEEAKKTLAAEMEKEARELSSKSSEKRPNLQKKQNSVRLSAKEEEELEEIFIRTYGKYEHRTPAKQTYSSNMTKKEKKEEDHLKEYLLVDGYNVIHCWAELKELAEDNMAAARGKLLDVLCNYQGFKKCTVIAVFDAYQLEGAPIRTYKYRNIYVVFTKEAETADQYIEKVAHEIGRKYHTTVVTSDGVEQVVIRGQGASLISSREFAVEMEIVRRQIMEEKEKHLDSSGKNYLFESMGEDFVREMEKVRLGKKEL